MNCPKCGRELLIGSVVCPVCDMTKEKPQKENVRKKRKLTRFGKLFIICICAIAVVFAGVFVVSLINGYRINGSRNGNYLNGGLAFDNGKNYYYSTENVLYCSTKKFGKTEKIDTAKVAPIGNIVSAGKCIYYTKDNGIYQFNPKTRKIKLICSFGEKLSVAGYSQHSIFYNAENRIYRLNLSDMSFEVFAWGNGVFDRNRLYLIENGELCCVHPKSYARKQIATVDEYICAAFAFGGRVYCYDKKNMKIISIGIKKGDTAEEFDSLLYENISDVEHVNIHGEYLLLRGENGVYRYNRKTKETVLLSKLGFMQSAVSLSDYIYTFSPDGYAHFSDINGNIKFTQAG